MQYIQSLLMVAVSLAALSTPVMAQPRELAVAISPYQDAAELNEQARSVFDELTTLARGDRAVLLDGYSLATLGQFNIPENKLYDSPKARAKVNRTAVAALLNFTRSPKAVGADGAPTVQGAIRLPQLLRKLASNLAEGKTLDVLVIGSALYADPADSAFSMADGLIPGDGYLQRPRTLTPFGAAGMVDALSGLRVHLVHSDPVRSNRHALAVERFWTLYIEAQGGQLVTYGNDLGDAWARAKNGARAPAHGFTASDTSKLEMIRFKPIEIKRSIYEREISTQGLSRSEARRAENVMVGITWQAEGCKGCDLDLYAQALPGAAVLSYKATKNPEGEYWKDYRNSPETVNGQETIAFAVPLDLRSLKLAVNFFSGSAPQGASGEVRLAVGEKTYAYGFHIPAVSGNGGRDVEAVMDAGISSKHTLLIDPLAVVGLAQSRP